MNIYDYVVVGSGIMGLMTLYELNKLNKKVLCLEQFSIGHEKGSSHGQTRAFHYGFYDRPDLIQKIKAAEKVWLELENIFGLPILHRVGKLELHPKDNIDINHIHKTKSLLITAGSWFELLKEHDLPLQKIHKELCWYDVNKSFGESTYTMPVFGFNLAEGFFYGFPSYNSQIKIARHTGGKVIQDSNEILNTKNDEEAKSVQQFAQKYLNGIESIPKLIKSCIYTNSSTKDYFVKQHASFKNVYYVSGFSGEGFKFAPEIAKQLLAKN